jgi:hypothetical protein
LAIKPPRAPAVFASGGLLPGAAFLPDGPWFLAQLGPNDTAATAATAAIGLPCAVVMDAKSWS